MNTTDAEKLAALWTKAQSTVAGFIFAMIPDSQAADDVLQETAMVCVRKFHTYDPSRSFDAWAVGIARYEVFAWRRNHANRPHLLDDATVERIADSYERLSERADAIRYALYACLEEASGRGRRALELHYGHGMKTEEVAAELKTTGGAARTLLSRTRSALRKCIERRLAVQGGAAP